MPKVKADEIQKLKMIPVYMTEEFAAAFGAAAKKAGVKRSRFIVEAAADALPAKVRAKLGTLPNARGKVKG